MSNDTSTSATDPARDAQDSPDADKISPLPGEFGLPNIAAPRKNGVSKKGLLAVGLLVGGLVGISAFSIHRFAASGKKTSAEDGKLGRERPAAATTEPRKLDLPTAAASGATTAATTVTNVKVPALTPTNEEMAEPIGVRRTATGAQATKGSRDVSPEDAPILLVSTRPNGVPSPASTSKPAAAGALVDEGDHEPGPNDPMAAASRNLQVYQRQLQGLLDNLTKSTEQATGGGQGVPSTAALLAAFPPPNTTAPTAPGGLFGGQLQGSSTPTVAARTLGDASLTLPKGTAFTCALKTRVISATSGLVGCQVLRHVYGADGRVVLVERGSHVDGEYRITSVKPGMVRIPVLWTRIRTPLGVVVDIDSPATGKLGEAGIDGHVDNRWTERIGAAMLLSLIDDSVKLVIQSQADDRQASTVVLPSTTSNTSKLAEKVLDSTINIPPMVYQNQGGIVGIYVARDVDFSSVYELVPTVSQATRH